jgi:hypothetical protein
MGEANMDLAAEFERRAEIYLQKARETKKPDDRRHYAAIAALCLRLASRTEIGMAATPQADDPRLARFLKRS